MKCLSLIVCLTLVCSLSAQKFLKKMKPIDPDRYEEIEGSPYYWVEPIEALLKLNSENQSYRVKLNVNLFQFRVEVYADNQFVELDYNDVMIISIPSQKMIVSPHKNKVIFQLHKGRKYRLLNTPKTTLEKMTHHIPGKEIKQKEFAKRNNYVLEMGKEEIKIELNKKSITKVLGRNAIEVAESRNNNLETEADLVALLKILEVS